MSTEILDRPRVGEEPCTNRPGCLCPTCRHHRRCMADLEKARRLSEEEATRWADEEEGMPERLAELRRQWGRAIEAAPETPPEPPTGDEADEFLVLLGEAERRLVAARDRLTAGQLAQGWGRDIDRDLLAVPVARKLWNQRLAWLHRQWHAMRAEATREVGVILNDTLPGSPIAEAFRKDDPLLLKEV